MISPAEYNFKIIILNKLSTYTFYSGNSRLKNHFATLVQAFAINNNKMHVTKCSYVFQKTFLFVLNAVRKSKYQLLSVKKVYPGKSVPIKYLTNETETLFKVTKKELVFYVKIKFENSYREN